jgi:hypothetical protein
MNAEDFTDDEIRLLKMLVRGYGTIARSNAQDGFTPEAERNSYERQYRTCVLLLGKLKTAEERLLAGAAQTA